jgi:hypothetical protein
MKEIPIGISDFKTLRENDYFYVDKSLFIKDIAKNVGKTLLFTRPRRFGKSLNMSMLYYYFDMKKAESNKNLFHELKIEKTEAWTEQGKYPVIFISFKDLKAETWEDCYRKLKDIIIDSFGVNLNIYESLNINKQKTV